ncbi:esterase-like activity of phytase family protein [Plectonema cf. radiosum LEGE 06105]|uniref:Esterase-like activity of phytase family protein n=1 Tax=Plectonema cf. radiosum LEGE 06105 TaxID=945769 RepID=A0A8J7F9B2_9CYAN|nr:esterase-like activity of phytase family protein [Plectonema radiosum]MBE9216962.1 esterase-like activity of phytase family protein [Plectonema cf. radiosum LEGE 06105]
MGIRKLFKLPLIIIFFVTIVLFVFVLSNLRTSAVEVTGINFIGEATLPTGTNFKNTELGGLSGITYDSQNQLYYIISDDRSQKSPARFYTFNINLNIDSFQSSDIKPVTVTKLKDKSGKIFSAGNIDPEGIALTNNSSIFVSSEGDTIAGINPFIKEFSLNSGQEISSLTIPEKYLPSKDKKRGIRNNLAFESLTITPDKKHLFTATENALIQDGEQAKPNQGSLCRILQYNLITRKLEKEFLYPTEIVKPFFNINGRFASGLTDLVALDNQGHFLSIERTFTGLGFVNSLFKISLENADNIQNINSLQKVDLKSIKPVKKELLLNLGNLDIALDNTEGLTIGETLPNGQPSLILVSDNNFNKLQRTQFLAFQLKIESRLERLLRLIRDRIS